MVHIVGAGPGAKDLITIRGKNYIEEANIIIYAGSLVNPELLEYASKDCQIYNSAYMDLEEIIDVIREADEKGLSIVRLHTGDPSIYGAIREQMDELDRLGIAYDICPGVSSLFGAAAALEVEYTLPDVSQTVIVSRAEGRTPVPDRESLGSLAAHRSTMVLFLSSGLAGKVSRELIEGGYEGNTRAAVVYKATWPDEKIIRTTLDKLEQDMKAADIDKTALIIVGDVLGNEYSKSKLYDGTFSTGFREGKKEKRI